MSTGVVLLNFGEPEPATPETVVPFLERIFAANASLEEGLDAEARRARTRELAERRAPGLIEDYDAIGGSPMNRQAAAQAEALAAELGARGHDARVYVGLQFTEPLIGQAVARAREDEVERLVGLPAYPLCGPSTTVAALEALSRAVGEADWEVPVAEIAGWHRHPEYIRMRADAIARAASEAEVDLRAPATRLLFSVHGTPVKYIREGSRYLEYAEECCSQVGAAVGRSDYLVGFQNHANRGIPWTQPDVEQVVREAEAERLVVDAISFVHEQSETLAELDRDLREEAEAAGLGFLRVPVPHDDPRLASVLADLVEPLLPGLPGAAGAGIELLHCRCRTGTGARCLNGGRRPA